MCVSPEKKRGFVDGPPWGDVTPSPCPGDECRGLRGHGVGEGGIWGGGRCQLSRGGSLPDVDPGADNVVGCHGLQGEAGSQAVVPSPSPFHPTPWGFLSAAPRPPNAPSPG